MPLRAAFASAFALILALAGCVTPPPAAEPSHSAEATALLATLRALPPPALDGNGTLEWLASFVGAYKPRITGTPSEKEAGDALGAQLKAMGYEVLDKKYGRSGAPSVDGPVRAVVGVKTGTREPDRIILLGAHYDTSFLLGNPDVPGAPFGAGLTTEAAYDNGSGTAMVMELARLLSQVDTNATIHFVFFNGEEEGLWGSDAYAEELVGQGADVQAYVGFDMVGINWPSTAGCLCIYSGEKFAEEFNPIQETVAFDLLGYPRSNETVQAFDNHKTRSSDEAAFQSAGLPTMRWAGMKSAGDYWAYHKLNDTIETMAAQAGGMDVLTVGLEKVAESAYYTVLALDAAATGRETSPQP